jgi:hypothetical protein
MFTYSYIKNNYKMRAWFQVSYTPFQILRQDSKRHSDFFFRRMFLWVDSQIKKNDYR